MQYRTLGKTDLEVSILGFGASPMGNVFDPVDEKEAISAVHYALDQGINFFDVSPFYGLTLAESRLGKALEGKRKEVILASKCGRYDLQDFDFSRKRILQSIDESLTRLKTDYLDLFQLHDIEFVDKKIILEEAVPAIQEVVQSGKARFWGITGLPVRYLAQIARETNPDTVLSWLMQRILSDGSLPPWHRSPAEVKAMQPILLELCKSYGVRLSDVALRYAMDHPYIATTIIGMCELEVVKQNVAALDFEIPSELLEKIETLLAPVKNRMWFEGKEENNI